MRMHLSSNYKDLSWLIGEPLKIISGIELDAYPDGGARIVADYPKHVLLEMTFIKSYWGMVIPPRRLYTQVLKSALACGDVKLQRKNSGMMITGGLVTDCITDEDALYRS